MSHQTKRKFRSKSIDKSMSSSYQQKQLKPKIHVNVLLENKSYNIIGFVIIEPENGNVSLTNLRKNIKLQFDEDQLELLGNGETFKFIMDKIPISTKQETLVTIKEIAISDKKAMKLMQRTVTAPGSDISDDDDDFPFDKQNQTSRPLSAPNTRKNSESIHFDKMPYHYQHMSANMMGSPNPSPAFLVIPTTPDTRHTNDKLQSKSFKLHSKSVRKKVRSNTGFLSPFKLSPRKTVDTNIPKTIIKIGNGNKNKNKNKNENQSMIHYSVIVRSNVRTSSLPAYHNSFRTLPMPPATTEMSQDVSMSIFTPITRNMQDETEMDTDDMETDSESSVGGSETDVTQFSAYSDMQTKLEQKFGGKLPRIQTKLGLFNGLNSVTNDENISINQVRNILRNALVNHDELKLKPMKSLRMHRINDDDDYSELQQENDEDGMFDSDKLYNNTMINDQCRFTVIGSAVNDNNNEKKRQQKMWIFYDPSELILGLQGVHHSENTPVWMDIVCDEETFVMIAEHVRPQIHILTVEDCISNDGGEKVELFDNYLFIRVDTASAADSHDGKLDKICMLMFKHMIITYHCSRISDIVITEARNRLEKRHKMKCPLNIGWVCHTIIDVIVDRMIPEITNRVCEVQNVQNLVFSLSGMSHNELLQRLQIARNWLIVYRARLWTKSTMTYNLMQTHWRNKFLNGIQQQFWNDINDHVARMVDLLSLGQTTLESAQNIFVAKLSLEMSEQSNALSDGASRLTAVGSVFLPLSFLSAVWGMNCKVPFQYEGPPEPNTSPEELLWSDDYFGFVIIFTCMIGVAIATYRYHRNYS